MAANFPTQPLIIIRRKAKGHGGHRSGAWKMAYADFVTAMMSLFMVLWLLGSSEQVKKAIGGYFTDPNGHGKDVGNGLRGNGTASLTVKKDDMTKLREKLEEAVHQTAGLERVRDNVVLTVTSEGLRIELIEGEGSLFFELGNAAPTASGKELLARLATEIGKLPNKITLEGHTDAKPYAGRAGYSNWELSSDRANAARRLMQANGMRDDQVTQVRGFADQSPRNSKDPNDPENRRVTMIIQYQEPTPTPPPTPDQAAPNPAAPHQTAKDHTAKDAPRPSLDKAHPQAT